MPFQLTLYYILLLSHIIMKIVLVPLFYLSGILQGITVVRLFVFSDRRKVSFAGSEENASERHVKAWWGYGDIHLFYHDFYRNWTKSNSLWAEHEVNAAVGFHLST